MITTWLSTQNLGRCRLPENQAIVTDGEIVTTTNDREVLITVEGSVATFTLKNIAFWEPFTVTAEEFEEIKVGYVRSSVGSITNEPVAGYNLYRVYSEISGYFSLNIEGPKPLGSELEGALIGIGVTTYSPNRISDESIAGGGWLTTIEIDDVTPAWEDGQQIPIVIIPQNGG